MGDLFKERDRERWLGRWQLLGVQEEEGRTKRRRGIETPNLNLMVGDRLGLANQTNTCG